MLHLKICILENDNEFYSPKKKTSNNNTLDTHAKIFCLNFSERTAFLNESVYDYLVFTLSIPESLTEDTNAWSFNTL